MTQHFSFCWIKRHGLFLSLLSLLLLLANATRTSRAGDGFVMHKSTKLSREKLVSG